VAASAAAAAAASRVPHQPADTATLHLAAIAQMPRPCLPHKASGALPPGVALLSDLAAALATSGTACQCSGGRPRSVAKPSAKHDASLRYGTRVRALTRRRRRYVFGWCGLR